MHFVPAAQGTTIKTGKVNEFMRVLCFIVKALKVKVQAALEVVVGGL